MVGEGVSVDGEGEAAEVELGVAEAGRLGVATADGAKTKKRRASTKRAVVTMEGVDVASDKTFEASDIEAGAMRDMELPMVHAMGIAV